MKRIPLWLDLRHVAADRSGAFLDAARAAHCEAILGADVAVRDDTLYRGDQAIGSWIRLRDGKDQERAARAEGLVVVACDDWTIIPLENLIAARRDRPGTLYAWTDDPDEALRFRDVLELGVHGIVLRPASPPDIRAVHHGLLAKGQRHDDAAADDTSIALAVAKVTALEDAGPGDRVCIDTTSNFHDGEGLLVGSTARAFVLVHAETLESEFVRARPFRVNAGAVHSYVLAPGSKTRYLSELRSGDRVLAVHPTQGERELTVGRVKVERRPHTLLRWEGPDGPGHLVAQTAETIRLVMPDGTPVAITDLGVGDEILVHAEHAARHFGMPVVESLEER